MNKRIQVVYTGRVQGVGFRFTAQTLAQGLSVAGWVKNLGNGAVEVVAEADEAVLKDFLEAINQHFSEYIHDADIQWQEAKGEFNDFGIRF
jgi:acylphosphatase